MTPRRLLSSLVLTCLVAAILIPAVVAPARADYRVDCNPDGDSRLVVLLVHGFNSGPDTWGGAAVDTLTAGGHDACVVRFDYSEASTRWVADPAIGPELAASIDSWSTTSRRAGGPGRVVIVAHSMGGLAARCALNTACAGRDVADDVATVVTMGTPYLGSGLRGTALTPAFNLLAAVAAADCRLRRWTDPTVAVTAALGLCRLIEALGTSEASLAFTPGSDQLESLHALPSQAATYATAGRAALVTSFFGRMRVELGSVGDLVVGVESALDGARTSQGRGGTETVDCGTVNLAITPGVGVGVIPWPDLSCHHVTETSDSRFLAAARRQIAASLTTTVNPRAAPTEVVVIDSPFAPDGSISAEYSVEDQTSFPPVDCAYDSGSTSALTGGTHWCGGTADSTHSCWESPATPGLLACIDEPWNPRLRLRHAIGVGETGPPELPEPLGIELADGTRWWLRHGGSWGGRADDLVGAYGCASESDCSYPGLGPYIAVLAGDGPAVDRTTEPWTVLIGDLDDPSVNYPDPIRISVRRAWFIANS